MPNENNRVVNLGDASLSREEAIKRALPISVSNLPSDQHPNLAAVKTLVLQEGPRVTKNVRCWDIRSRSTGKVKYSSMIFETLKRTKARGWELEEHHSFSLGDKNNPSAVEKLFRFLSSMKSLENSGDFIILDSKGIEFEKLGDALNIVSKTGQQSEFFSTFLEWIHEEPQAQSRLTQLSSDDQHRSQSLIAAINYGRYFRALTHFQQMVDEDLHEHEYQKFLQENYWLFGSEYSELLDARNLVVRQQLDFPLRRTADGYFELIEIKKPLDGNSGFYYDKSHKTYYPGREVLQGTSQVLNYLASLETHRNDILVENKIDVTRVRGKLIIGSDGCEKEKRARRLFNENSVSVEVISFDGLIQIGQRILDIMVAENPTLREIHSQRAESDENDVGEIPF